MFLFFPYTNGTIKRARCYYLSVFGMSPSNAKYRAVMSLCTITNQSTSHSSLASPNWSFNMYLPSIDDFPNTCLLYKLPDFQTLIRRASNESLTIEIICDIVD